MRITMTVGALLVACAIAVMVTGRSIWGSEEAATDVATFENDLGQSEVTCETAPTKLPVDTCFVIKVNEAHVRYALIGGDTSATEVTLVDLGGPGIAALGPNGISEALLPLIELLGDDRQILVIEEPWVTASESEDCWKAGRQYVTYVLSGNAPVSTIADACLEPVQLGWSKQTYQRTVEEILEAHHLKLDGFVGTSFASVRLQYLEQIPAWVVLNSPFPVGTETEQIAEHQARRMQSHYEALQADAPDASSNLLAAVALGLIDQPLTSYEGIAVDDISHAARSTIGSYGNGELSLSRLAFFGEFCIIGGNISGRVDSNADGNLLSFLTRLYSPCDEFKSTKQNVNLLFPPQTCIAISEDDAQIPLEIAVDWANSNALDPKILAGLPHGDLALFEACEGVVPT